jgi:hypothetical protein
VCVCVCQGGRGVTLHFSFQGSSESGTGKVQRWCWSPGVRTGIGAPENVDITAHCSSSRSFSPQSQYRGSLFSSVTLGKQAWVPLLCILVQSGKEVSDQPAPPSLALHSSPLPHLARGQTVLGSSGFPVCNLGWVMFLLESQFISTLQLR